jgi:GT2 family glycosyltransferase
MEVTEVFGADGALPLYRRSMIEDVAQNGEFFDSMFFAHKEDWDVAWRARWRGWKTICDPSCVAVHPRSFKPETLKVRATMSAEVRYHTVKNQLILLLKNIDFATGLQRLPAIAFRQLEILSYVLLIERGSLRAYSFVMQNVLTILRNRQKIRSGRKVSPRQMRKFLDGEFS